MLRSLVKNWQLNSIAVLSLAIAMAVTVVALSVSNAILFRPPVARDPARLVTIYAADRAHNGAPGNFSYQEYLYIRDHARSFSGMAALPYGYSKQIITYGGRDEMVMENDVSDNYFQVMGIRPFMGRTFSAGDDGKQERSVVLTYACWKRWGADPKILGRSIKLNSQTLTIIGVMPKEFIAPVFGIGADLIENFGLRSEQTGEGSPADRLAYRYLILARLAPDAIRPQARAEVQSLWGQIATAFPESTGKRAPVITGLNILSPDSVESARVLSAVMIAAALLILLIACANTANLLLALATLRRQEALIKTALGAPRRRLIGEFLRETVAVCGAGGVLGYAIAMAALHWLSRFDMTVPPFGSFPIAVDLHPGLLVVAGTVVAILAASVVSGLAPALYASKPNLAGALSGEIAIGGTRRSWIRNTVVAVQVAVSTLALAGTGLCLESLRNLRNVDPGFSERNIAAAYVFPESDTVKEEDGKHRFDSIREQMLGLPGVQAVAISNDLPLGGDSPDSKMVSFPDRPASPEPIQIGHSIVDENYFATLGVRLLEGRAFRPTSGKGPEEVVINRFMAEKYWPKQPALGRAILLGKEHSPAVVVGIAANGKYSDLDEPQQAYLYLALDRHFQAAAMLIVRTAGDPKLVFEPMTRVVRQAGEKLPLPPMTMDDLFDLTLFDQRMTLACVIGLSVLAMLLATVGLYGAISYSVRERRRELGIRIALGARPGQVMRLVFRRTLAIGGTGVVIGLGLGIASSVIFRSQFYRISVLEWRVLAPVGVTMAAGSLAIAYAAARRWTRMNPMDAVRHI